MCVRLCVCVCVSGFDVAESTSIVIYITQLCCLPFAFDISDVLMANIQRYCYVIFSAHFYKNCI